VGARLTVKESRSAFCDGGPPFLTTAASGGLRRLLFSTAVDDSPLAVVYLLAAPCLALIMCRGGADTSQATTASATALVDVKVVPMDRERILEAQTVIVRNGHIAAIRPSGELEVPAGARQVAGQGAHLMPGLVDMHAHVDRDSDLLLFLANGVTTVRNMAGGPVHLEQRERIARGELLGPTMFTAGPIIDGPVELWPGNKAPPLPPDDYEVIETRLEAMDVVREQSAAGYDFIKVYDNLPVEAYAGVVAAAAQQDLPVAGHVPFGVGLTGVLASGITSIEHLRGYVYELIARDASDSLGWDKRSRFLAWNHLDPDRIGKAVQATAAAGVWNVPTLTRYQKNMMPTEAHLERYTSPKARYLPPSLVQRLIDSRSFGDAGRYGAFSEEDFVAGAAVFEAKKSLVRALHDADAKILVGSDDWFAGFATHQELQNLVAAGLTPYEAIAAGTSQAATFLGTDHETGTVEIGKRADLVLLRGNPLEDVRNTRALLGVMLRGQWLPQDRLQHLLAEVMASYRSEATTDR
jgi:imidazolonepropionase-like amidohydrolase